MSTFHNVLNLARKFWYVLVIIAIIALGFWAKSWYDDKIEQSYNKGVSVTDTKWKKIQQEKDRLTNQFLKEQQAKADKLAEDLAKSQQELANEKLNGGEKQIIYVNSPQGKSKGLDDDFVDIYNDSLGR